jgi:hypothetical protein
LSHPTSLLTNPQSAIRPTPTRSWPGASS